MSLLAKARSFFDGRIPGRPKGLSARARSRGRQPGRSIGEMLEDRVLLTHFRYGYLSWEPVAKTANTIDFHLQIAERIDSSSDGAAIKVGDIITDTTGGNPSFNYGDGTNSGGVTFRVTGLTSTYYSGEAVRLVSPGVYTEGLIHAYTTAVAVHGLGS